MEGKTWDEARKNHPEIYSAFKQTNSKKNENSGNLNFKYDLGETDEQIIERTRQGLDQVLKEIFVQDGSHKTVVIVSHGGALKRLLMHHVLAEGIEEEHKEYVGNHLLISNTSISQFVVSKAENESFQFAIDRLACTEHLSKIGFHKAWNPVDNRTSQK